MVISCILSCFIIRLITLNIFICFPVTENLCTSRKTTIRFAVNPTTRMSQKQQQTTNNKSGSVTTGSRCDGMEDKSHEKQAIGTRKHQETQHIQDCGHGEGDRLRFKVSVGMGKKGRLSDF